MRPTRYPRGRSAPAAAVIGVLTILAVAPATSAVACDLCAIYTATTMREERLGPQIGVAEQFSRFTTLRDDGHTIDNIAHERLNSSITQLLLGYNFNSRVGVQLTIPIIARTFHRLEDGVLRSGHETGFGDLALIGVVRPFNRVTDAGIVGLSLFGGLKLPSGSAARLGEEVAEDPGAAAALAVPGRVAGAAHGGAAHEDAVVSGIHGHDLALGSGSVDGLVGGEVFWSWRRVFANAGLQYAIRTRGAFDYRYANDLIWNGGPGVFVWLAHASTVTLQAVTTGEHKGKDTLGDETEGDTAITAVYLGPAVAMTFGTSFAADVAADFPILQDNSGVQIVPDYRIRGGVTWRF